MAFDRAKGRKTLNDLNGENRTHPENGLYGLFEKAFLSPFDDGFWNGLLPNFDLTLNSRPLNGSKIDPPDIQGSVSTPHTAAWSVPASASTIPIHETGITYTKMGFADDGSFPTPQTAPTPPNDPARYLVQFETGSDRAQQSMALAALGADFVKIIRDADAQAGALILIEVAPSAEAALLQALGQNSAIRFVERDATIGVQAIANDTYTANGSQWGVYGDTSSPSNMYGSQAAEVWSSGKTGSMKIVVGDVDTGIDYTHPDLYLNVWLNQGEIRKDVALFDVDGDGLITFRDLNAFQNAAYVSDINKNGRIDAGDLLKDTRWANGQDNDKDGYIDDLIGWDFVNNDNDPYDDNNHGTHTAGTIGAIGGNGTGVAGLNWSVSLMALKFMDGKGSGALSSAIKALDYYTTVSALDTTPSKFIGTNNSWGAGSYSQALLDAITRGAKQDALFTAAAGNGGADGVGDNNDLIGNYPSNYSTASTAGFESVIAVAALASNGSLASFSNYGGTAVDLGAPGSGIWSTIAGGGYASYSGTSMATPHVTGALALLASAYPDLSASQLRDVLLNTTITTPSLNGKAVTGGRLDVSAMFGATNAPTPTSPPTATTATTVYGTSGNDILVGTSGNDVLSGISSGITNNTLGKGSIDKLTGGAGSDLFVLGDARGVYYNDGLANNAGMNDYAVITDFSSIDKIQLKGGSYFLNSLFLNGSTGLGLYWDCNGNGKYDAKDEFVCHLQGLASVSTSQFVFV